jgi:hypothetical protein
MHAFLISLEKKSKNLYANEGKKGTCDIMASGRKPSSLSLRGVNGTLESKAYASDDKGH